MLHVLAQIGIPVFQVLHSSFVREIHFNFMNEFPPVGVKLQHLAWRVKDSEVVATHKLMQTFDERCDGKLLRDVGKWILKLKKQRSWASVPFKQFKDMSREGGVRPENAGFCRTWLAAVQSDSSNLYMPLLNLGPGATSGSDGTVYYDCGNIAYTRLVCCLIDRFEDRDALPESAEKIGDYVEVLLALAKEERRKCLTAERWPHAKPNNLQESAIAVEMALFEMREIATKEPLLKVAGPANKEHCNRWVWMLDEIRVGLFKRLEARLQVQHEFVHASDPVIFFDQIKHRAEYGMPLHVYCGCCHRWVSAFNNFPAHVESCCELELARETLVFAMEQMLYPAISLFTKTWNRPTQYCSECNEVHFHLPMYAITDMPADVWSLYGEALCKILFSGQRQLCCSACC